MNMKRELRQAPPFPLRMEPEVRAAVEEAKQREERSATWVINDRLKRAFGLKEAA